MVSTNAKSSSFLSTILNNILIKKAKGDFWLEGKKTDDKTEGLWRIHDCLYDFGHFVEKHPGGSEWLQMTKGTDITEAFEAHHISNAPQNMLTHFFVRKTKSPRNSPFTFKPDGFYSVLKSRVKEVLKNVPEAPARNSKLMIDAMLVSFVVFSLLAAKEHNYLIGLVAGVSLGLMAIAAHNFFHQKDNFRMYYFHFSMMEAREWRISHVLSHHLYTNTINDLEISSFEPHLQHLPTKKHPIHKYGSWFYTPIVYALLFFYHFSKSIIYRICYRETKLKMTDVIPFVVPVLMVLFSSHSIFSTLTIFLWIEVIGSIYFAIVGVNAGHHDPDVFHDGDAPRPKNELDWGVYQVDAIMDRNDITGSHFLVLTSFGDHCLHHLFPTVDHGKLQFLYPVFEETCKEFGIKLKMVTQLDCIKGQFRQLSNTTPKTIPPGPRLKQPSIKTKTR